VKGSLRLRLTRDSQNSRSLARRPIRSIHDSNERRSGVRRPNSRSRRRTATRPTCIHFRRRRIDYGAFCFARRRHRSKRQDRDGAKHLSLSCTLSRTPNGAPPPEATWKLAGGERSETTGTCPNKGFRPERGGGSAPIRVPRSRRKSSLYHPAI
jgi:hypothetical protein